MVKWPGNAARDQKIESLMIQLAAEQARRERIELEFDRLRVDFQSLVQVTAGRVPPRLNSPTLDRDIFAEDLTQTEKFLSPDPDEIVVDIESVIKQVEDNPSGGSA